MHSSCTPHDQLHTRNNGPNHEAKCKDADDGQDRVQTNGLALAVGPVTAAARPGLCPLQRHAPPDATFTLQQISEYGEKNK